MTGKALMLAKDSLFAASARSGVPNIACVLTASRSTDDVDSSAQMLKGSGATCISIGMGKYYDLGQLRAIATDPYSQHMFRADFNALGSLVSPVVATCRKGKLSTYFGDQSSLVTSEPQKVFSCLIWGPDFALQTLQYFPTVLFLNICLRSVASVRCPH